MQLAIAAVATLAWMAFCCAVVWAAKLVAAPAKIAAERQATIGAMEAKLAAENDITERRRTLARLLGQAQHIQRQCASPTPIDEHMLNDWFERTRTFLTEELGEEYWHRFESDAGILGLELSYEGAPDRNRKAWAWLYRRATRLNSFLERLPTRL
jgi:hypothetical protein